MIWRSLLQAPKPGSPDRMPPSRIADLEVRMADLEDASAGLEASWTSPGDDYADGQVAGYKILYSEDTTDLLDTFAGKQRFKVCFSVSNQSTLQ